MADVDWTLIGVASSEDDAEVIVPFIYTVGLFDKHNQPELWASVAGECGHNITLDGLGMVLNDLASKLVDTGRLNEPVPIPFESRLSEDPVVLTFIPHKSSRTVRDRLQTFAASRRAPVIEITWRCCDG